MYQFIKQIKLNINIITIVRKIILIPKIHITVKQKHKQKKCYNVI